MGSKYRCFMVEPTGRARLSLRRYVSGNEDCPSAWKYHQASNPFPGPEAGETWPGRFDAEGNLLSYEDLAPSKRDRRWPKKCKECGVPLPKETVFQVFQEEVYRRVETDEEWGLRNLPIGAMYYSPWAESFGVGPDGKSLVVCLPPGGGLDYWQIDGPSKGGGRWTRTGTPPNVTVTPSILTSSYHGFLRGGCLEATPDSKS